MASRGGRQDTSAAPAGWGEASVAAHCSWRRVHAAGAEERPAKAGGGRYAEKSMPRGGAPASHEEQRRRRR